MKHHKTDWMNPQAWTAFGIISPTICFGALALTLAFGIDLELCLLGISIGIAALSMYQLPEHTPRIQRAILLPLSAVIVFAYSTQTSNTMADAHESILNSEGRISLGVPTSAYAGSPPPTMEYLPGGQVAVTYWKRGNAYTAKVDPDLFNAIGILYADSTKIGAQEFHKKSPFRVFQN